VRAGSGGSWEPVSRGGRGADWVSMWAVARVDAGLSEADFHRLSFRRFAALSDRLIRARHHAERRAGTVAAVIHNMLAGGGRALGPEDFFLDLGGPESQTTEEQIAIAAALTAAWGGQDL